MLGNSIALVTLAVMLASEGKRAAPPWRYGLFTLATVVALIALALKPIANELPGVGLTLNAIFGNPLAWFVLFMGMFFVLRPFWVPKQSDRGALPIQGGSDLRERVSHLEETRPDYGHVAPLEHSLDALKSRLDHLDGWKEQLGRLLVETNGLLTERSKLLEEKTDGTDARLEREVQRLTASQSLSSDWQRQQVASLYDALGAILHREQLRDMGNLLEAGAKELSAPTELGTHLDQEQWEEWQANERAWRSTLVQWCDLASCYARDIKERVLTLSDDHYLQTGVAEGAQFPRPEAFIAYKAFWGRLKNWRNWRGEADRAVHQVAFSGTAQSRPIIMRGGDEQESR